MNQIFSQEGGASAANLARCSPTDDSDDCGGSQELGYLKLIEPVRIRDSDRELDGERTRRHVLEDTIGCTA